MIVPVTTETTPHFSCFSSMKLIQIYIPLCDPNGIPFPDGYFGEMQQVLTERFGGLTIYKRSPAVGLWKASEGSVVKDEIVIFEVMADHLDTDFWTDYKVKLTKRFEQDELLIRCQEVQLL